MTRQPYLTARLQGFGTTIFTEMSALAVQHGAVNLGQGFPDFAAPRAITEAAQKAIADGYNQYAPGDGLPRLRAAIAGHATRHHGLAYDPDYEITVTTGATEAVFVALNALLDTGDEAVLFEPFYDSYLASIAMAGGVARAVPMRPREDGRWHFDEADLRAAVDQRTRVIVLNTPHNPTGKAYDTAELELIAAVAAEHDLVIITDEVYEHLTFGRPHLSMAQIPGAKDRTIRISSAAKTFSVTGWKVGWCCAPAPLTAALRAAHQWTTFTSGTPFQHAVTEALAFGDDYFEPLATEYLRRRDLLAEALDGLGFKVFTTEGTYFLSTDVRPLGFEDDLAFCRLLPEHVGVGAIPISAFYLDRREGRGFVRFAFCKTDEALQEGIARLKAGLPQMTEGRS